MSGETGRTPWGMGRVAFLANISQFKEKVSSGWPLMQIYKDHQQNLRGISYAQFTHYVRKYIHSDRNSLDEGPLHLKTATFDARPRRFQPSPKVPNPEDLI